MNFALVAGFIVHDVNSHASRGDLGGWSDDAAKIDPLFTGRIKKARKITRWSLTAAVTFGKGGQAVTAAGSLPPRNRSIQECGNGDDCLYSIVAGLLHAKPSTTTVECAERQRMWFTKLAGTTSDCDSLTVSSSFSVFQRVSFDKVALSADKFRRELSVHVMMFDRPARSTCDYLGPRRRAQRGRTKIREPSSCHRERVYIQRSRVFASANTKFAWAPIVNFENGDVQCSGRCGTERNKWCCGSGEHGFDDLNCSSIYLATTSGTSSYVS